MGGSGYPCLCRYVHKGGIFPFVAVEQIGLFLRDTRNVQIQSSIVVVVSPCHPFYITHHGNSYFLGYLGKGTICFVAE